VKCLVTGAGGQLATELMRHAPTNVEVHALPIESLDITSPDQIADHMGSIRPDLVVNAAAWTDVDGAESHEPEAISINSDGPRLLAESCDAHSARMVHVSTDFVFDGQSSVPCRPEDGTSPLSVYGKTKLDGEKAVLETLPSSGLVVRTAWLYSSHGHNFLLTMLKLMRERDHIRVVCDQHGTPTSASSLANAIWDMAGMSASGLYHWTNGGRTTWHGFAQSIHDLARAKGILDHDVVIEAIPGAEWPTPAQRPANSVLDISATETIIGRKAVPWNDELDTILDEILATSGKIDA
tara:strand:+ start:4296 stop:5180 length:885 start_codon:yes stop_codon:yes gene_type:complete